MQDLLPPAIWLLELCVVSLSAAGAWGTFHKAGQPGWSALVPVYNLVVLVRAAGLRGGHWVLLFLLPGVNLVALGMASVALARRFGRGTPFGLGLAFAPFVFYPLLAWDPQATFTPTWQARGAPWRRRRGQEEA